MYPSKIGYMGDTILNLAYLKMSFSTSSLICDLVLYGILGCKLFFLEGIVLLAFRVIFKKLNISLISFLCM
jgi:hypothetical protein